MTTGTDEPGTPWGNKGGLASMGRLSPSGPADVGQRLSLTKPQDSADSSSDDLWLQSIERSTRPIVAAFGGTGLLSVFPRQSDDDRSVQVRPRHFLLRAGDGAGQPSTIAPVVHRPLDLYEPFRRVATDNGQLWALDRSLIDILEPGSSAIGIPFPVGEMSRGALTLFRTPDQPAFTLDDLLRLDALVNDRLTGAARPGGDHALHHLVAADAGIPLFPATSHAIALRHILSDLLVANTPYDVAQRLARGAKSFFDAQSCVVYFVVGGQSTAPSRADAPGVDRVHLMLAASVGSGVLLTPPWLEPVESAAAGSLFATSAGGTVLLANIGAEAPWIEHRPADDMLVAVPLRLDGEIVAVLGMRCPDGLTSMRPVTVENFALIGAMCLQASRRREADQSTILVLRSDLARNRLANQAAVAMLGATDLDLALRSHSGVLVPGLADGYLVYLDSPVRGGGREDRGKEALRRRFSHWRTHRDPDAIGPLERLVDDHMDRLSTEITQVDQHPVLLTDLAPTQTGRPDDPPPAVRSLVAIPLVPSGQRSGWLVLVTTEHGRRYAKRDLDLMASLAAPINRFLAARTDARITTTPTAYASAPDWSQTAASEAQAIGREATDLVAGIASRLVGTHEIDEICDIVAQALATSLTDWCAIELRGASGSPNRTTGAHADPNQEWPARFWRRLIQNRETARGPVNVLRTGQSDLSGTVTWIVPPAEQESEGASQGPTLTPASSVSAAIMDSNEIIGVVSCFRSSPARPFTLGDLATVDLVAAVTGDAIASARQRALEREAGARDHWLAEQRTQLIAELADAVIVIDPEGRIIFANHSARELHGGADLPESMVDYICRFRPVRLDGGLYSAETFPLSAALASGSQQRGAWRITPGDQPTITVVGRAAPLQGNDGSVTGAVLSLHDITEADEAQSLRDRLLQELAAELRPPIGSIKGWTQYLGQRLREEDETGPSSRASDAIDAIARQVRVLQQLADRLATVGRDVPLEDAANSAPGRH